MNTNDMNTNEMSNKYFLPVAVVFAGILIAGAVIWSGGQSAKAPGAGTAPVVNIKDVNIKGDPFIGKVDAPVTIAFWGDFQCPFCKRFELKTLPTIVKEYVDNGKAKVVFMDFAFLGNDSITAGLYSRAIWKLYPKQYFVWRTAMYKAQDAEGDKGFGNASSIDKLDATIQGLDAVKIKADVKVNTSIYRAEMDANKTSASKIGINATPSFVIGTKLIVGAYPYPTFKSAIDTVLAK